MKTSNNIYITLMMNLRSTLRILLLMFFAIPAMQTAMAVSSYATLEARALRFFTHSEWAPAAACFDLMLDERPEVAQTYGRAIVANGAIGHSDAQLALMQKALDNHIPFDSIFSEVRSCAYSIGKAEEFEKFLKLNRNASPWMTRQIDTQLLRYYRFRANGAEMIELSRKLLAGAPENIEFLSALAKGYMLTGQFTEGIDTYLIINNLDRNNLTALLALGNWYLENPVDGVDGKAFLRQAYLIRPTPYLAKLLQ